MSEPKDKKTESDSFPKHAMKENHSSEFCANVCGDRIDGEISNE